MKGDNSWDNGSASLAQHAYQMILDRILRGDLTFGTPLSRRNLANEFGMSVLPVTEALQRLQSDGLLESWPRVGTRVRVPTTRDLRDFFIVREALESQAARQFAEHASVSDRRVLRRMAVALDRYFDRLSRSKNRKRKDVFELYQRESEFHLAIAQRGGCLGLSKALERNQMLSFHWLSEINFPPAIQPPRWHQHLAEVLCRGDIPKADEAMRQHVRLGLDDYLRAIEPYHQLREAPLRVPYAKTRRRRQGLLTP